MTETSLAGAALARQQNDPATLIQSRQADFYKVLPEQLRDPRWIRLAESAVNKSPQLQNAARSNPASLMQALLKCASLGHEPGGNDFYLVPQKGGIEGWESWRGILKRILFSGKYSKVVAEVVYEGEEFEFDPNNDSRPRHKIDFLARSKGAKPLMSYAYAVHLDGTPSMVAVADPGHIAKIRAGKTGPTWNQWDTQMYLKSAIKKLEPWVDKSAEDKRRHTRVEVGEPIRDTELPALEGELLDEPVVDVTGLPEAPILDGEFDVQEAA